MTLLNVRQPIQAILFDMDGTLLDSEIYTEKSVQSLLQSEKLEFSDLDLKQFYGITWHSITEKLLALVPELKLPAREIQQRLQKDFHDRFVNEPPAYIPGALDFYKSAANIFKVAIASSSNRESIEQLLERMQAKSITHGIVGAENYENSKPAPDCYLRAAALLGVQAGACLVFEDSIPGLQAARNAGMACVAVTFRSSDQEQARRLADLSIHEYTDLPPDFLKNLPGS